MTTNENFITLDQLRDALAPVLPRDKDGQVHPPCARTIYFWMASKPYPMPFIQKPGSGKGTGKRTGRWFRLSDVLEWLESPEAFYARRKHKAS